MAACNRSFALEADGMAISSSVIMAVAPRAASFANVAESAALEVKELEEMWDWKPTARRL